MSKTAEEILLDKVLSEEQKECDQEFWKRKNRHELPKYLSAMREFAAQEVEAYRERLKAELAGEWGLNDDHLNLSALLKIEKLIDTVK